MKTILVPTDFSKNAGYALKYAMMLADNETSELILLHVFSLPFVTINPPVVFSPEEINKMQEDAGRELHTLCYKIISKGIKCQVRTAWGMTEESILEIAGDCKADVIVMGAKSSGGIQKLFAGKHGVHIMESAGCPVILVSGNVSFSRIKKISYATDYHISDVEAIKKLISVAGINYPSVTVIHISQDADETEEKRLQGFAEMLREKLNYKNIVHLLLAGKDVTQVLDDYVQQKKPHLLVISARNKTFFDRLFGKSISKEAAYQLKAPLMIFHQKEKSTVFL